MELLIEHNADVNVKNWNGRTAIMEGNEILMKTWFFALINFLYFIWASSKGHKEIVELLIEHNVDVNEKDNYGRTAVMEGNKMLIIIKLREF